MELNIKLNWKLNEIFDSKIILKIASFNEVLWSLLFGFWVHEEKNSAKSLQKWIYKRFNGECRPLGMGIGILANFYEIVFPSLKYNLLSMVSVVWKRNYFFLEQEEGDSRRM